MNADRKRLDENPERVIGSAFTVANGLAAEVYENALALELAKAGLMEGNKSSSELNTVGSYLLVENAILVEIQAVRAQRITMLV
jgi:hypothetical protein